MKTFRTDEKRPLNRLARERMLARMDGSNGSSNDDDKEKQEAIHWYCMKMGLDDSHAPILSADEIDTAIREYRASQKRQMKFDGKDGAKNARARMVGRLYDGNH